MAERAPVEWLGERLGLALTGGRPTGGGQGRTYHAKLDGTAVVVKWGFDPDLPEKIPYLASQVPELLRRDCPVPRILAYGPLGAAGYGWVLEWLAGTRSTVLGEALLGDLVALIDRLAGVPPGPHRNDLGYWVPAVVFEDVAGYWRTAAAMSPDAARFCRRLRAWTGRPPLRHPVSNGYVHADLSRGNVLVSGGRLSGIIDTEHLGVGDRSVDLARLAFEWYLQARVGAPSLATGGLDRLAALGRAISGEAGWRVAVAYELISRVGWRSEHHDPVDPHAELPVCAEFLGEPAIQ